MLHRFNLIRRIYPVISFELIMTDPRSIREAADINKKKAAEKKFKIHGLNLLRLTLYLINKIKSIQKNLASAKRLYRSCKSV